MQMTFGSASHRTGNVVEKRLSGLAAVLEGRGLLHAACLYSSDRDHFEPFYIWRNGKSMRGFLLGNWFSEVVEGLDRPRVRTWHVLNYDRGPWRAAPEFAVREVDALGEDDNLSVIARREAKRHRDALACPDLNARVVMLDPERWEIARVSLWRSSSSALPGDADCVESYRVARVCCPVGNA